MRRRTSGDVPGAAVDPAAPGPGAAAPTRRERRRAIEPAPPPPGAGADERPLPPLPAAPPPLDPVPKATWRWWLLAALAFGPVVWVVVATRNEPPGSTAPLVLAAPIITYAGVAIAPWLRRPRPRRPWVLASTGAVCLALAFAVRLRPVSLGPLAATDVFYLSGYVCFVAWLWSLGRAAAAENRGTAVDVAAASIGTLLALWSSIIAPLSRGDSIETALVWSVYPMLDVVLIALGVHLALQHRRIVPSLWILLTALTAQFVFDTLASVAVLAAPHLMPSLVSLYLFTLFGIALAAAHPSVPWLVVGTTPRRRRGRRRVGAGQTSGLLVLAGLPPILAIAAPSAGGLDTVIRTVLVSALLALLFGRLTSTIGAANRAQDQARQRATYDGLTGLLNRRALVDELTRRLERPRRRPVAVFFLDCDDFKYVNDTWGHEAGDTLLRDIAERLPRQLRSVDTVARQGGDEFVILADVVDAADATQIAERITRFFDEPVQIMPGRVHTVSFSLGLAVAEPGDDVGPQALLARADLAMYEAKHAGRGRCVVFDDVLAQRSHHAAAVGNRLHAAVRSQAVTVHLQPIRGGDGFDRVVAFEALARWTDAELGPIRPDVFIGVAEQLGLIRELGEHVLTLACADLARLRAADPAADQRIFVNVSPTQLLQPGFADTVLGIARRAGIPADRLYLEVTETTLLDPGPVVAGALADLRAAGVGIVIDDFGTGYASLATLLRMSVDVVKIDKSLTERIDADPAAVRQVGAVVELMHSLGIALVVAEGVETASQAEALRSVGCPLAQGWHFGRPAPVEALLAAAAAEAVDVRRLVDAVGDAVGVEPVGVEPVGVEPVGVEPVGVEAVVVEADAAGPGARPALDGPGVAVAE